MESAPHKTRQQLLAEKALASEAIAADLAALGYPGFVYLHTAPRRLNPAEVVLRALSQSDLEARVVEALPWVLLAYPDLDWDWLREQARRKDLQNRLGYLTNLARQVARLRGEPVAAARLAREEATLEPTRLLPEDTLCQTLMTQAEREYLLEHRPAAARHWRVLADIAPEHLGYATF